MELHKVGVHVSFPVTVSTRYMPNSEIAGSYSTFVFRFLRNLCPVLCRAYYETAFLAEAKEGPLCSRPSPASDGHNELSPQSSLQPAQILSSSRKPSGPSNPRDPRQGGPAQEASTQDTRLNSRSSTLAGELEKRSCWSWKASRGHPWSTL